MAARKTTKVVSRRSEGWKLYKELVQPVDRTIQWNSSSEVVIWDAVRAAKEERRYKRYQEMTLRDRRERRWLTGVDNEMLAAGIFAIVAAVYVVRMLS